jgi:hypothetical protein
MAELWFGLIGAEASIFWALNSGFGGETDGLNGL